MTCQSCQNNQMVRSNSQTQSSHQAKSSHQNNTQFQGNYQTKNNTRAEGCDCTQMKGYSQVNGNSLVNGSSQMNSQRHTNSYPQANNSPQLGHCFQQQDIPSNDCSPGNQSSNSQANYLRPTVTNIGLAKLCEWRENAELRYVGFGGVPIDDAELNNSMAYLPNQIQELGLVDIDGKKVEDCNPPSLNISVAVSGSYVKTRHSIYTVGIFLVKKTQNEVSCPDNNNMVLFAYVNHPEPIGHIGPNGDFILNFHLRLTGENAELIQLSRKVEPITIKQRQMFWSEETYENCLPVPKLNEPMTVTFMDMNKSAFRSGEFDGNTIESDNIGDYSVAFGQDTMASANHSFSQGVGLRASHPNQFVIGSYNHVDDSQQSDPNHAFIIGNGQWQPGDNGGVDSAIRSNAFTVAKNGDVASAGGITSANGFYQEVYIDTSTIGTPSAAVAIDIKSGSLLYLDGVHEIPIPEQAGQSRFIPKVTFSKLKPDSGVRTFCGIYQGPTISAGTMVPGVYPAQLFGVGEVLIDLQGTGVDIGALVYAQTFGASLDSTQGEAIGKIVGINDQLTASGKALVLLKSTI